MQCKKKREAVFLIVMPALFTFLAIEAISAQSLEGQMEMRQVQPNPIQHARDLLKQYPDNARLELPELSEDEEKKVVDLIGRKDKLYTSITRPVSVGRGNWHLVGQQDDFSIWQMHVHSPEARGLRIWFSGFELYNSMLVTVYGPSTDTRAHVGEYTGKGFAGSMDFWSLYIPGDTLVVEVWTLDKAQTPADFPFEIRHVDHHFRDNVDNIQPLRSHYIDIQQSHDNCSGIDSDLCVFPDNVERWRGVARITYTPRPGAGNGGQCTAGLLATRTRDMQDAGFYLLTAYHCIAEGSNPEMARGTSLNVDIAIGVSNCVPQNQRINNRGRGVRFIAGHMRGDYALLWVDRSDLASVSPSSFFLLGWSGASLPTGAFIETFHHAQGNQSYAETRIISLSHAAELDVLDDMGRRADRFETCVNSSGCSHYRVHVEQGALGSGASGAPMWVRQETMVHGIWTHGSSSACSGSVSRMSKIFEDGRVDCALDHGDAYYPDDTVSCNDTARPAYSNRSSGGGGGGGGAMDVAWLLLLAAGMTLGAALRLSPSGWHRKRADD